MNHSKTVVEESEVYSHRVRKGLNIIVEVYRTPKEFIVFASSKLPEHDDLVGMAKHEKKDESVKLAINDLSKLLKE